MKEDSAQNKRQDKYIFLFTLYVTLKSTKINYIYQDNDYIFLSIQFCTIFQQTHSVIVGNNVLLQAGEKTVL